MFISIIRYILCQGARREVTLRSQSFRGRRVYRSHAVLMENLPRTWYGDLVVTGGGHEFMQIELWNFRGIYKSSYDRLKLIRTVFFSQYLSCFKNEYKVFTLNYKNKKCVSLVYACDSCSIKVIDVFFSLRRRNISHSTHSWEKFLDEISLNGKNLVESLEEETSAERYASRTICESREFKNNFLWWIFSFCQA